MANGLNTTTISSSRLIADEQIRQLYASSYLFLGAMLVSAIILAYFQWPVIGHKVIWIWLISVWVVTLVRLIATWQFREFSKSNSGYEAWGNYFQTGVLLAGVTWGSASYFLFPVNDVAHQALLAIIMAGMSASAVSVLSARWSAVVLFLVPSLLPLAIRFLSIDDPRFILLGVVVIAFLGFMLSSAKRNHNNILASIIARIEKQTDEALVEARARQLKNSEERLNHLIKSSPIVIYSCEAFGDYAATFCSDTMYDVFGYKPSEFVDTPGFWAEGIHPDDKERVFTEMEKLFINDWHEHEYRFRMPDGSYRWVYDELRLIRDEEGEPMEIIGCWIDINERKLAQEHLRQSEERFRTLVENVADAILVHDLQGDFVDVNQQACTSLGYSKDELLGMSVADVEMGADLEEIVDVWNKMEFGKILTVEGIHKRKDGTTFPVEVNLSLIVMDNKSCVIALARDVTKRKRTESQLREVNKELEAFAYSVSHDLRAPLRSINGFCHILLDEYSDVMDEDALKYMQRIVGASTKMSDLIDDLLQLSRVSRREIKLENFNLSEMVLDSTRLLKASDPDREVDITIQPGLVLKADKGLFNVVIQNLVSNAWKYSSKNETTVIKFCSTYEDGRQVFSVCDRGAGFNMDYIDKLFQPFQRLHPEKEFEGNGIGLATVQKIIHRHGGQVWAESREGEGACFYFAL